MANCRAGTIPGFGLRAFQAWWALQLAALGLVLALPAGSAQDPTQTRHPEVDAPIPQPLPLVKERYLVNKFPDRPSIPPTLSIPLEPLGFSTPGAIYLGARNSLASLDFLDENHLLFTFRVPGLLHRDSAKDEESTERQIRALVLALPQGNVVADTQWTVHDRARYLWTLKDGHFLLRDRNSLFEGDATLKLKPLLDFPGNLLWLDLDPSQDLMVTNSREPLPKPAKQQPPADATSSEGSTSAAQPDSPSSGQAKPGEVGTPSTASANLTADSENGDQDNTEPNLVVRILRRASGEVMLVSRAHTPVQLPINSQGYLENLRQSSGWVLNLNYFTGGSKMLGTVASFCSPTDDFVSEDEILVTGCGTLGESRLTAMTTNGRTLWATQAPPTEIWPKLVTAANGLSLAWETLDTDHPVNSYAPIWPEDVKEQSVTVFDAANGDIALVSPVNPVMDEGGNVAISPTGRRVALLNAGAIQVFDLPAPPPLPTAPAKHSTH